MSTQPTVHVVVDDPAVRRSLRALLKSMGHRFAGYAGAEAFLETYDPSQPGCLVLDVQVLRKMAVSSAAGLVRVILLSERDARVD